MVRFAGAQKQISRNYTARLIGFYQITYALYFLYSVEPLTLSVGWDQRELLDQTHHKGKDALDNYRDAVPIRMDSIALV